MADVVEIGKRYGWQLALLVALPLIAYWSAIHGQFVFDDDLLITNCDLVKMPDGLYRIWFTTQPIDVYPVTNSSFWIDWHVWGTDPTGYHLTNLVLHIADSILLWIILRRLSIPGAFLAALLFAILPVNVESVAWIAQRKNVLAMFFGLISVLWYLKADGSIAALDSNTADDGSNRRAGSKPILWYWLGVVAFLFAMLSKGSVAVLPVLLLWITWWKRPLTRRDCLRSVPLFVIAAALTIINMWSQSRNPEVIRTATLVERLLGAGAVPWFYLSKAVWPSSLSFIYPQWEIHADSLRWWIPLIASVAISVVLWTRRSVGWVRSLLVAWGFSCVALLPVMGFTDVGYYMQFSLVADHYQHLAIIAVTTIVAAGIICATKSSAVLKSVRAGAALHVFSAGIVALLAVLTWQQSALYANPITLYQDTLQKNPDSWLVYTNLAIAKYKAKQFDQSIALARRALELNPNSPRAYDTLGSDLMQLGRTEDAIAQFEKALAIQPSLPITRTNLGAAYASLNRLQEAIDEYQRALEARPQYPSANNNLGLALMKIGKLPEAIDHFQAALVLEPDNPEFLDNLGQALDASAHPREAIDSYLRSLARRPEIPKVHYDLGVAYLHSEDSPRAIQQFETALKLNPNNAQCEVNFAVALSNLGQVSQAVEHLERAVNIDPKLIQARLNLAILYYQLKQPNEAIASAEKALELARSRHDQSLTQQIQALLKDLPSGKTNP